MRAIEHDQALRHVIDRSVELPFFFFDGLLILIQPDQLTP